MALDYTKLWKLLIDKELTKTELMQLSGISSRTLAKLSKNETVTTDTISRICGVLHCDVGDIMEFTEEKKNMTLYKYYRECGIVTFKGENHRTVSFTAGEKDYTVYATAKKATQASHIHCKPDGSIYWEQLYPFGGMSTPSSATDFLMKPELKPGVITIVIISGKPGIITGLDEGCCKSHRGRLNSDRDFYVMSEAAFKLFEANFNK